MWTCSYINFYWKLQKLLFCSGMPATKNTLNDAKSFLSTCDFKGEKNKHSFTIGGELKCIAKTKFIELNNKQIFWQGIIEDCTRVGFAPYNLSYPDLDEDFSKSGINKKVNNWDEIDDFNWLSNEKSSPHWYILEEDQRKKDWLLWYMLWYIHWICIKTLHFIV